MESHFKLSDAEFENQFENCELIPTIFSHEAHLRSAWIYINKYGVEKAVRQLCSQLRNYVNHLGANDKYNETLTIAAVRTVYHFMLKSKSYTFESFIRKNLRLKHKFNKAYLESIFLNLITNAIKYSKPDCFPILSIHSEKKKDFDQLIISDNGLGFDMEKVKDKVFGFHQTFHNLDDSKGIGLYLVHTHVTSFGGKITVESKINEGAKSIISFRE